MSVQVLTQILSQLLPEPHAGLLAGILFGTKATLDPTLKQALITSGTIHMIALSGQNISILVTVMTPLLVLLFSRRIASLLIILTLIGYVAFVGVSPSVVRAAIMGSVNVFAVIVGRASWSLFTWILAVSSMIVLHPLWIADVGFQLSAAASLGIILFGGTESMKGTHLRRSVAKEAMARRRQGYGGQAGCMEGAVWGSILKSTEGLPLVIKKFIGDVCGKPSLNPSASLGVNEEHLSACPVNPKDFTGSLKNVFHTLAPMLWSKALLTIQSELRITLAAQSLTIPLILWYFHRVSLSAPLSNLAVGWSMPYLMVFGWLAAFFGWIWYPLGLVFAWVSWVLLEWMIRVVLFVDTIPFASIGW